jgi:serine/threonine protein kinase
LFSTSTKTINERYILRQLLGQGATSYVYRATDELLKREVSIKIYNSSISAWSDSDEQRFLKEAKIAARLEHNHLAAIYSVGITEGSPFIVMELVEGKSLATHLSTEGPLSVHQALDVIEQVCSAAQYLHEHGLIHRDIKPANIMLTNDNDKLTARLIDLGLAKQQMSTIELQQRGQTQTKSGVTVGTPIYMSPEQLCGRKVDARSDVFSIGAVLYEALTNERAFDCTESLSHPVTTLTTEPEPMSQASPGLLVPPSVENAALKAMSKNPDNRYQSALLFGEALANIRTALTLGTTLPIINKPKPTSYQGTRLDIITQARDKRKLTITRAAIAIALSSVGAIIWLSSGPTEGRTWFNFGRFEHIQHPVHSRVVVDERNAHDEETIAYSLWAESVNNTDISHNKDLLLATKRLIDRNCGFSVQERKMRGIGRLRLGLIYDKMHNLPESIANYESAMIDLRGIYSSEPDFIPKARCNLAMLIYQRNLEHAEDLLSTPSGNPPDGAKDIFSKTTCTVAEESLKQGHIEKATYLFKRSLACIDKEKYPRRYCEAWVALAKCRIIAGDKFVATDACKKAIAVREQLPCSCPPWLDLQVDELRKQLASYQ